MKFLPKELFLLALFVLTGTIGWGQPVASTKQEIGGLQIYSDYKKSKRFYYAPGDLQLASDPDGKPQFQLLEMRYTGSANYDDQGEKRFLNLVQFTVAMEHQNSEALQMIKQQLPSNADLRPLPITSIEAILVTPIAGADGANSYQKIGDGGSFQSDGENGVSSKGSYWNERTYTIKLENHEAQLLWDQIENGQLALSLGYSFYADMILGSEGDTHVAGDPDIVEDFESRAEDIIAADTIVTRQIIKADAFPIRIDTDLWPDLLKKLDINEGVPPAYAALEVRCYDFAQDLRPDLAIKSIELQATGISGQTVSLGPEKFISHQRDLHTRQINFPYAVRMDEPLRYRITEYSLEGNRQVTPWITKDSWIGSLDITTPLTDQKFVKKNIEIEVDLSEMANKDIEQIEVSFLYHYRAQLQRQVIVFTADSELPIQGISIQSDIDSEILFESTIRYQSNLLGRQKGKVITDDYIYIDSAEHAPVSSEVTN